MKLRLLSAALLLALPTLAQKRAAVGDQVPEFSFGQLLNGDGRQNLSDFYGQPVVIDFWGVHCGPCIGAAVPAAIRHDHEFQKDGLVTVLVHSQQATADQLQAFMLKTFADNDCLVSVGASTPTPSFSGIPHAAIIGVDGKLLFDGPALADPKQMEELIAAELLKVKKGWGATAEARKVRAALYGKNDLFAAATLIAAMPDGEDRAALQGELDRRYTLRKKMVTEQQANGHWLAAQDAAKDLLRSVGTKAEWLAEVQPMLAAFDSDEGKAGLAADRKLDKVVKQLRDKKRDGAPKALEALVKAAASPKVAARAQSLLTALSTELP